MRRTHPATASTASSFLHGLCDSGNQRCGRLMRLDRATQSRGIEIVLCTGNPANPGRVAATQSHAALHANRHSLRSDPATDERVSAEILDAFHAGTHAVL